MTVAPPVVAFYARVSSDQQAQERTIDSQIHALVERIAADGFTLDEHLRFIDDGHSGTTLLRPALERLRDQIAARTINRLYVLAPDRLARKYAYQVLLLDEFTRVGVEVVFLNHALGSSPEENLLLQVQGMIAEYERAKILERSRRGKLQAARRGSVNVLLQAPYGYRRIDRHEGQGEAALVIHEDEARVVRDVFRWVAEERCTLGAVVRRLKEAGIVSPEGKANWSRGTIAGLLRNSTYQGSAKYGKTRVGERRVRLRPAKGQPAQPKRPFGIYKTAPADQIAIATPALVTPEQFATVAEQLQENQKRHRQRKEGASHLLQGLIVCAQCDHAFYGKPVTSTYKNKKSRYVYYRCVGCEPYRFGGTKVCTNRQVRADTLESAVWTDVAALVSDPKRMAEEVRRRLSPQPEAGREAERLAEQIRRTRLGLGRVMDAYENGAIERAEFEQRNQRLRTRLGELETQVQASDRQNAEATHAEAILASLNQFAATVQDRLATANWNLKRDVIRALVKRVEIDKEEVRIVYRIPPQPLNAQPSSDDGSLLRCPGTAHSWQGAVSLVRRLAGDLHR
jgi:site-specific DNA recombinase